MKNKTAYLFILLFITIHNYAQYTDLINSNRPGKSMSAFSVGKSVIQAEGGLSYIREKNDDLDYQADGFITETSLRYGALLEQLEFNLDTQFQYDWFQSPMEYSRRKGFKQFTLGAKYLIYDPFLNIKEKPNLYSWKANHKFSWKDFIPAVGIYGGFNIRVGNNPFTFEGDAIISPKMMLITQNHFGIKYVFVTNIIVDKLSTTNPSYGIITTLTRGFNMRWSGFFEIQGYSSSLYSDTVFRSGAAYLVRENIQLDASISTNIKNNPSLIYGNIGMAWRFDSDYQTVYKRVNNDKKEDKKKDKKSKKDKGKKRKDEVELENTKP